MNKTLVTGGLGLVGSAFKEELKDAIFPSKQELNLLNREQVFDYISSSKIDTIIHVAAKVGGVGANMAYMNSFYSENIQMNTNVIDACIQNNIKQLVCFLSTCIYPSEKYVQFPLTEEQLHKGEPHESNFGYAYAKRMVDIHLRAVKEQYGLNYMSVIPNNLYGKHDNFNLENAHVLPALIRKIWESKLNSSSSFEVWGDGEIYREFTYSSDIVKIILFCLENYKKIEPINIGNTKEYLLKDVISLICKELEYDGEIFYNKSKPKGQIRKPTSNKKLLDLGWKEEEYTSLRDGIKYTCDWFKDNYPNVRGYSEYNRN